MPTCDIGNNVQLYYEDQGQGRPILFIHGMLMSSRFFHKQLAGLSGKYRVVAVDLRGHGGSAQYHSGLTMAQFARDVHALIEKLGLKDVTLAGWSMGSFVIWDYFRQFGAENIAGVIVIDESPSDFKWPDWPLGFTDLQGLTEIMDVLQSDRRGFVVDFAPSMFHHPLPPEDMQWVVEEMCRMDESNASAIVFSQTMQDYRPDLAKVTVPTLLCFGRGDQLVPWQVGEYLEKNMPNARLVVFEESGHCAYLEESERFNAEVDKFLSALG